jgi:hypothetical protein
MSLARAYERKEEATNISKGRGTNYPLMTMAKGGAPGMVANLATPNRLRFKRLTTEELVYRCRTSSPDQPTNGHESSPGLRAQGGGYQQLQR